MAESEPEVSETARPAASGGLPLYRRIQFWAFAGLMAIGVAFYVAWGLRFGGWLDNGVYAVTIVLLLFGLVGMWITTPSPAIAAPPSTRP